jgi:hypothetical protein
MVPDHANGAARATKGSHTVLATRRDGGVIHNVASNTERPIGVAVWQTHADDTVAEIHRRRQRAEQRLPIRAAIAPGRGCVGYEPLKRPSQCCATGGGYRRPADKVSTIHLCHDFPRFVTIDDLRLSTAS